MLDKHSLLLEIKDKGIYPITKDTPEQEKQAIRELLAYECITAQTVSSYRLGENGYECIKAESWEKWLEGRKEVSKVPEKLIEKAWFQILLILLSATMTALLGYLFS